LHFSPTGLSVELEDLKENYEKITKERNSLQQKLFKMQSEFCSVEIERDLEKETSRYFEEQISSVNSSLLLKENELVSLRKRYKLLNEGFLNSETLREGLEGDVSELNKIIRDLEERLEVTQSNLQDKAAELTVEKAKAKLETEITTLNETLKKERNSKINLQEMLTNVEKERSLLLKEVEELRNEHHQQLNEVNVLRDLLHEKNKQEQLHHLQEEQLQREKQQQHSNEIDQLRENKIQLSNELSILENENKKLEDELYQQLSVLEKLEVENKSLAGAEEQLEGILRKLKVLGFGSIEELITENSRLREDKDELERKIKHLDIGEVSGGKLESNSTATSKDCLHFGVNQNKSPCVPKSEHIKLKFQIKSLTDEVKNLKQTLEPKNVKGRRSRRHENSMAKKWLKTMKDGMNAVGIEDEGECGSKVFLENQLHEANIRIDALQHELEISRKENEVLVSTKMKREEGMTALKRQLIEIQESHDSSLKHMKMKLQKAEQKLEDENRKVIGMEEKLANLEDHNQEMCIELEKLKEKFQSLQKEKERTRNELESLKNDILENFGSLSIQGICDSLTLTKEKSVEYVKIIEANKSNLAKLTQEINSLQQVNTVLREELNDVRVQLETKEEEISKKYLDDSISQQRESERLRVVMQALESSKQNEAELLAMYTTEKQEWEKSHEELMKLNSELQETKILLSEKEKECETTRHILRELEATCEVYEMEFEKAAKEKENQDDDSQEDDLSDSGSDSTAENFREMQEALQERMTMKVKRLQSKLEETVAALSSCQKMNTDLQKKMHDVEKRNQETVEIDERTPDKEFIETILKKLSDKEEEIQEILRTHSSTLEDGKKECNTGNNVDELTSPYKETIKQLKIDNAKNEVRLAEADERMAELENKLAMCQNLRENDTLIVDRCNNLTLESAAISKENLNNNVAVNNDLKAELDSTTAKYVNLKAAFEGCLRRLKSMEGEDGIEKEEPGKVSEVERYKSSEVEEMVRRSKFISPLQERKTKTAEVQTGFLETSNFEKDQETQAINSSSFSEISCAFIESDSESEAIGSDRMVIELTLTENDLDSLKSGDEDEFLQERLEYENEFVRLRARIIELEKLNSTTTNEIHRVKENSFKERADLESKFRSLQQLNNLMEVKLGAIEEERDSSEERAKQSEIAHSEAKQELQQINLATAKKQQEATENTIKDLKNQESTFKKKIMKTELENDELKITIKELQDKLEVYKREKGSDELTISHLKENVCEVEDEMRRSKDKNLKLEGSIKEFESVIYNLEKQNTDLKCEKENVFQENTELRHGNEILVKKQELNMVASLSEKQDLENKVIELQTTVKSLEGSLVNEKMNNADLTCKIRMENEHSEILLRENNIFEDTKKHMQERVMILEREVEELNLEKINSEALRKELKEKIGLLNEENKQRIKALSDEKQSLEITNKESEVMITELNEKYLVENMEKDGTISQLQNDNLSLRAEKEKLEFHVSSYVDEIQRIKSSSFDEREKLEKMVKNLQRTNVSMEKMADEDKQVIETLNLTINDSEAKCLYLQKELERVKICSFNENQLEDKIEKLTEALSSIEIKFEALKVEKDHLVLKEKELDQVIWRLQEELQRIKICAFEERQNKTAEAENYNVMAEESRTNFKYQILEPDRQISSLRLTVSELDDVRRTLESDNYIKDEEICALKTKEEDLQHEVERFEKKVDDYKNEISTMTETLGELNEEKRRLQMKVLQQDEEISSMNEVVAALQDEKKQLQDEKKQLEETIENNARQSSKEKSTAQVLLENLEKQKKLLKDDVVNCKSEIALLKRKASQLEEDKQCLTTTIDEKNQELRMTEEKHGSEIALLKKSVSELEVEKEDLTNCIDAQANELSEGRAVLKKIEDERNVLKEKNDKQTNEMSSLETTVAEIDNEKESLANNFQEQEVELSRVKISMNELENEKNAIEDEISKRNSEISLLESKTFSLESEKETLLDDITKKDEKISAFIQRIEKYEDERKYFESKIAKDEEEILTLRNNVENIAEAKTSIEIDLQKREEELLSTRETLRSLQDENKLMENNEVELNEKFSDCTMKIGRYQEEISVLKNELQKITNEKENVESKIKEINEKSKCEEDDFDKLVAGYLQEIDSWKKRFGSMEEAMTVLKNEMEKLQYEKEDLENTIHEMRESERASEEMFQENIKMYYEDIDSWKLKVQDLQNDAEFLRKTVQKLERECEDRKLELKRANEDKEKSGKLQQEVVTKLQKERENSEKQWLLEKENEIENLRVEMESQHAIKVMQLHDSFAAKELASKDKIKSTESELTSLQNELSAIQKQYSEDEKCENSAKKSIEKSQERLRILLADIDETTKIKVGLEGELTVLKSEIKQQSEEKIKLEMNVFCLKEITEELTKGKLTLLEEIARLSDQKKEGQELLNSEFARLRISNNELQNNNEKIEKENSELIVQISSLKITLATVQSAYEQTQDEIKNHKMRLDERMIREKHNNQEREKIDEEYRKTEVQLKHLEERYQRTIEENKDLSLSLNETKKRLETLEKEIYTIQSENVVLKQRVKQQGNEENDEGLDSGKSSTQALRKKLKEFRAKLSEEKKQRELHEFEIKNLKEKVERFMKKAKENEVQLEDTRKKWLEVKTERDGLLMDIDSLNKRKKKDMEGYTSKIETLENEMR
jgi:chromosome segregation ATPase